MGKITPAADHLDRRRGSAPGDDLEPGTDRIAVRHRSHELNEDRSARLGEAVFEDRDGGFDVRDRQIEIAVAVIVTAGQPPAHVGEGEIGSRLRIAAAEAVAVEAEEEWFLEEWGVVWMLDDVPIGDHDVTPAVGIEIVDGRAETDEQATDVGDAIPTADMEEVAPSLVAVEGKPLALEVRHPQIGESVTVEVAEVDPHAPVGDPLVVEGRTTDQPHLREVATAVVDVEEVVGGVIGHVDVEVAIDVEIGQEHPEPLAILPQPHRGGGIGERAVPVAEIDRIGQPFKRSWRTDVAHGVGGRADGMVVERPVHIAGEIEIEVTVAIKIPPAGAGTPPGVFPGR